MNKLLIALIAVLLLAAPAVAETKIGIVDLQKALNRSKAGVSAKKDIEAQLKRFEAEFKSKESELKSLKDELEKQAVLLSDSAKAEKELEYQKNVKDLQRFNKDVKDELQQKDAAHTKRILNELFAILQKIGKDGGYSMVIEKNEGAVIYNDENVDLTDQLIKAYDAGQN